MILRLRRRGGEPEETKKDIASFRQEGRGVRVFDVDGNDIGYFGPEEYESIILGPRTPAEGERDSHTDGL